jgi:hypothetical protein
MASSATGPTRLAFCLIGVCSPVLIACSVLSVVDSGCPGPMKISLYLTSICLIFSLSLSFPTYCMLSLYNGFKCSGRFELSCVTFSCSNSCKSSRVCTNILGPSFNRFTVVSCSSEGGHTCTVCVLKTSDVSWAVRSMVPGHSVLFLCVKLVIGRVTLSCARMIVAGIPSDPLS